ncbi:Gfo/Idh/MocA family protein [Martelella radicis]|uniref:D-galactose 1-dehydrogenase n=1 Tax=Martelella radicis TaxID=1397476 RepID=A0A7W6P880_9HYPH|nr:Gfo/Idh/MocA family oxidoreductase [Martelella radicis]MBB4120952.1 D-galactose 1-dehydrogenase [Martelella radicis]
MSAFRIAIVGYGKIAGDEHRPAIDRSGDFELAAIVTKGAAPSGTPVFSDLSSLFDAGPAVDCVALCVPTAARFALAAEALEAGKHVLLEKPPAVTLEEIETLRQKAAAKGLSLFAAWHSRFAPGVATARDLLSDAHIRSVRLTWKEDVRRWHPDQSWIFEPESLGVFDMGINGLSLASAVLPAPFAVQGATLAYPENRKVPVTAMLDIAMDGCDNFLAAFDWNHNGADDKALEVETDRGMLLLDRSGERLAFNGALLLDRPQREYEAVYSRFAALIGSGESDVDATPLGHVGEAFATAEQKTTEPFFC